MNIIKIAVLSFLFLTLSLTQVFAWSPWDDMKPGDLIIEKEKGKPVGKIEGNSKALTVWIYPKNESNINFKVYDSSSKLIKEETYSFFMPAPSAEGVFLDLGDIPSGIYILVVNGGGYDKKSKRFVIADSKNPDVTPW